MSRPSFEQLTRKHVVYIVFRKYTVYSASVPSKCFYTRSREIVDTRKRQDKKKDGVDLRPFNEMRSHGSLRVP